jgi:DNA-binding NarL/FixJ family response regulator
VFACEPQPIVCEGLARVLGRSEDLEYIGSAPTARESLEAVRQTRPDILLIDQSGGLKVVFQFITDVRSTWADCRPVLWITEMAEVDCFRALQVGARGILKKTMAVESVVECLRSVHSGNVWIEHSLSEKAAGPERRLRLTPRERDIVHHVCSGLKNREIAEALTITPGTVKVHLMHIFEKTGVKDRFELAVHGRRMLGTDQSAASGRGEIANAIAAPAD